MLAVRRLLVPTDRGPCAAHAYAHALRLATVFEAELHLVYADVPTDSLFDEQPVPLSPAPDGIRLVEATAYGDSIAEALLGYAEAHEIDLIVMGTHGRTGLAHFFLGSIAERIVRGAACPVLTVRTPRKEGERLDPSSIGLSPIRRILAPIDFSERAEAALKHAVALAEPFGATIDVLHAVDVPVLPEFYDTGLLGATPDLVERSRDSLGRIIEHVVPAALRGEILVEVDVPATAIVDAARNRETDLIVMATHGLTGMKRFTLGSVAERVVQRAACPVFTVKSFGKSLLPSEAEQGAAVTVIAERGNSSSASSAAVL